MFIGGARKAIKEYMEKQSEHPKRSAGPTQICNALKKDGGQARSKPENQPRRTTLDSENDLPIW